MSDHAADRLKDVQAQIARAEAAAGRPAGSATLIAVSKTFPATDIAPVIAAGQKVFGENRVQEAMGKWPQLRDQSDNIDLHLIGPLQTNKVKDAVALFDAIHSIDRDRLAARVATEMQAQGRQLKLFIQVNTGEEDQKAGILPGDADGFIGRCRDEHSLQIAGLMCLPPAGDMPAPHFALLAKIARRNGLEELSMGMSADFESAIHQGATLVRVGSAIFGPRG